MMKRRHFLRCALGGAGLGTLGWISGVQKKGAGDFKELVRCVRQTRALGSEVRCTVYAPDLETAEEAIAAAFAEIERVESLMSLYRPQSQLSRLNANGFLKNPDPDLVRVLRHAMDLSERTDGAFDVTVQPLWDLYQKAAQSGTTPNQEDLRTACRNIGWQQLNISDNWITSGPGIKITLNGVAQGFAADMANRALTTHGIRHAILDTGEVDPVGSHPLRKDWTVGIKHPRHPGALLGTTQLRNRSLATSGDYESRFTNDYRNHHLFNPQTGLSASECCSVSVAAPTTMQADALSTAAFVLGVERGLELIRSIPDADALFVTNNGQITRTPGFHVADLKTI